MTLIVCCEPPELTCNALALFSFILSPTTQPNEMSRVGRILQVTLRVFCSLTSSEDTKIYSKDIDSVIEHNSASTCIFIHRREVLDVTAEFSSHLLFVAGERESAG